MTERALRFGANGSLVGVLTDPEDGVPRRHQAIVLLGAGIVHRIGPHRLYVKIARQLAAAGFVVFRFDFSGIGDSAVRGDGIPLERSAVLETREAMDCLSKISGIDRFVLVAICSGAGFSFQTARADPRVVGISLLNAAGHRWTTGDEFARTMLHHYWRMLWSRPFRRNNWRKLRSLDFDRAGVWTAAGSRVRFFFTRTAGKRPTDRQPIIDAFRGLVDRGVRVQVVYSEGDEGWDYYQVFLRPPLRALESHPDFTLQIVPGANHTFILLSHQAAVIQILRTWLEDRKWQ